MGRNFCNPATDSASYYADGKSSATSYNYDGYNPNYNSDYNPDYNADYSQNKFEFEAKQNETLDDSELRQKFAEFIDPKRAKKVFILLEGEGNDASTSMIRMRMIFDF